MRIQVGASSQKKGLERGWKQRVSAGRDGCEARVLRMRKTPTLPISLLILRKKPTVLQSSVNKEAENSFYWCPTLRFLTWFTQCSKLNVLLYTMVARNEILVTRKKGHFVQHYISIWKNQNGCSIIAFEFGGAHDISRLNTQRTRFKLGKLSKRQSVNDI